MPCDSHWIMRQRPLFSYLAQITLSLVRNHQHAHLSKSQIANFDHRVYGISPKSWRGPTSVPASCIVGGTRPMGPIGWLRLWSYNSCVSETHFKLIPHVAARDTFVDRSTDLIFSTNYVVTPAQPPTCSSLKITNCYGINFWFILPASSDSVAFTFLFVHYKHLISLTIHHLNYYHCHHPALLYCFITG